MPTMVFEDSTWVENLSGYGPAIYVLYGQVDLRFRRCYFRCDSVLPVDSTTLLLIADGVPGSMSRGDQEARSLC